MRLFLDDTDPYAPFAAGREPDVQNVQSRNRWQVLAQHAWEALVHSQADTADSLAETMCSLIPLAPATDGEPYSATSPEAFGSAMMQLPMSPASLAVSLIHEFQHVKLGALLDLITLTRDGDGPLHYAPWRPDPRPASGLMQGAYAYLGVVGFWRRYHPTAPGQEALQARFAYARWRGGTLAVIDDLLASDELTELGVWFVTNMREVLARWCDEPLPPQVEADAALVATDHLGMWRLRNGQPSGSDAGLLAAYWNGGRLSACPAVDNSVVRAGVLPREAAVRSDLARLRWEDPKRFEWLRRYPELLGATSADIALLDGDFDTALRGYRRQVAIRPEASSPWIGLGLAAKGNGDLPVAAALLGRPELVRAVYLRLLEDAVRIDAFALAEWIGQRCGAEAVAAPPPRPT
ncbi:aKG-HExxH-type peptide beta-hydroxylase [Streptomyces scabichelini]|uniref:aKG-HExxH-type peptide beta-hydroxylase n=1 Tax=Streptomyces scabichelini TaxID=2711217 RepID=UPI001F49E97D|nr:HEXXH motif-containing putative peptide modification protein [Streptomyces scabichelini]